MPREVELDDAFARNRVDIGARIETMIERADEDVVDVEQDAAVGALCDLREELPFGHLRIAKRHVAGNILDEHGTLEEVLRLANARRDMTHNLGGVWQRQQIMQIASADARPAQVI